MGLDCDINLYLLVLMGSIMLSPKPYQIFVIKVCILSNRTMMWIGIIRNIKYWEDSNHLCLFSAFLKQGQSDCRKNGT